MSGRSGTIGSNGGQSNSSRMEVADAMDRDLLDTFGDAIGTGDYGIPSFNALMLMNHHMVNQQLGQHNGMFPYNDILNSRPFPMMNSGHFLGMPGMSLNHPFPGPGGAPFATAAAAAAAAAAVAQAEQSQRNSTGKRENQDPILGGSAPPLNKRKFVVPQDSESVVSVAPSKKEIKALHANASRERRRYILNIIS